jgi:hypothetical protein
MKQVKILGIAVTLVFLVGTLALAEQAAEKAKPAKAPVSDEQKKAEEMWAKMATPGKYHQMLAKDVGSWVITTKSWMEPGKEPESTTGSAEFKMIFGGRFLQGDYKGMMMGQPFEGFGITGYDNYKEEFVSLWLDTMGTAIYELKGKCEGADCKATNYSGEWDDCMTKSKMKVRAVQTVVDETTRKYEMFMVGKDGKEFKSMEMVYKKKK